MRRSIVVATALLAGCALAPDAIRPEFEHMSHASEHRPMTDTPERWGANWANLLAIWRVHGFEIAAGEGVSLDQCARVSCGETIGPREEFTLRIGYNWEVRK